VTCVYLSGAAIVFAGFSLSLMLVSQGQTKDVVGYRMLHAVVAQEAPPPHPGAGDDPTVEPVGLTTYPCFPVCLVLHSHALGC
jgi:hypothetical protein